VLLVVEQATTHAVRVAVVNLMIVLGVKPYYYWVDWSRIGGRCAVEKGSVDWSTFDLEGLG